MSDLSRGITARAVDVGALKKPRWCECCGKPAHRNGPKKAGLHAHHPDYSRPLYVFWLCRSCHAQWRRRRKARKLPEAMTLIALVVPKSRAVAWRKVAEADKRTLENWVAYRAHRAASK